VELMEVFAGKSATGANSVAPSQLSSLVNDSPVGSEVIWPLSDDFFLIFFLFNHTRIRPI